MNGMIDGSASTRRVEVKRVIPAPIDEVWQALIDPAAIAEWFTEASIDAREGGRLELRFGDQLVTGDIKVFAPPHALTYTWEQEGESSSLVQFDLIELSAGETQVTVIQTALDAHVGEEVLEGWNTMLGRLDNFVGARCH